MKKKNKFIIALALLALVCSAALAGCSGKADTTYKVTFVDLTAQNSILRADDVKEGEKAVEWTPAKEGYIFDRWYATPDMLHPYDFATPVTGDTTVYGYFVRDTFEADTRQFYIAGTSSDPGSVFYGSNWKITDAEKQKLKKADKADINEYTVNVDLYAGDMFQLVINDAFQNQRGFGYLVGEAVSEYFEISANYLDPNPRKANILVKKNGFYSLTLTTHPWCDEYETTHESYTEAEKENFNFNVRDTIDFARLGDNLVAPSDEALEIHVKGSYITGWSHDTSKEFTMAYDEEKDVYTYSHEFVAGDAFMFYNFTKVFGDDGQMHTTLGSIMLNTDRVDRENSDVSHLILDPSSNIVAKDSGTYSFVYDRKTNLLSVKYDPTFTAGYTPADTWYITGGGITEPLKSSQYGSNLTDAQKFAKGEGEHTYTLTLDLARGDIFQVVMNRWYGGQHGYTDIVEPEKDGTVYFSLSGDKANARVEISGNYTLTLTLDPVSPVGDAITWVRNGDIVQELPIQYDVFMKSAPDTGADWVISDRHPTGSGAQEGIVEFRAFLTADKQFCFIYYEPGVPDEEVGNFQNPGSLVSAFMKGETGAYNANFDAFENNFVCKVAGFYVIRIDYTGGTPVVDFTGYRETMPEFEAIIKGAAIEAGWSGTEKVASVNAQVEMLVTFIQTGETTLADGQFGFAWWDENTTTSYGNWIGAGNIGTKGDANDLFINAEDKNNFIASVTGTYKVVIDMSSGKPVVDFYATQN